MTDPEAVLAALEQAWRAGPPPDLGEFATAADPGLVRELVMLDLEYRWRRYAASAHDWLGPEVPPRLEGYATRLPGLVVDASLVGEEFRARHVWGDKPPADEYRSRFPALAAELAVSLPALLGELAAETTDPVAEIPAPAGDVELTAFGPYRLTGRLGGGAMGVVYRGEHADTGAAVAVKVLRPDLLADREAVARLDREARLLARLDHPNVVRLVGVERVGGRVGLVTELVAGRTLAERVRSDGPLPLADAVVALRDALAGLAFVHAQGLVHRDVSPANLIAGPDGRVRLLDLGLAKVRADRPRLPPRGHSSWLTPQGVALIGTPDYLAPEAARSAAGPPADVYAVGCVAHFLLTGRPPFPAASHFRTALRHATEPSPDLRLARPGVPDRLAGLVDRLLAKPPTDRPSAADAGAALG